MKPMQNRKFNSSVTDMPVQLTQQLLQNQKLNSSVTGMPVQLTQQLTLNRKLNSKLDPTPIIRQMGAPFPVAKVEVEMSEELSMCIEGSDTKPEGAPLMGVMPPLHPQPPHPHLLLLPTHLLPLLTLLYTISKLLIQLFLQLKLLVKLLVSPQLLIRLGLKLIMIT